MAEALGFARRWWWLLAAGVVLAAVSTLLVVSRLPSLYDARARVLVSPDAASDFAPGVGGDQITSTYAAVIRSRPVLATVLAATPGLSYEQLDQSLDVTPVAGTQYIELVFRGTDPRQAAAIVNGLATTAIEHIRAAREAQLADRRNRLTDLANQSAAAVAALMDQVASLRGAADANSGAAELARAEAALTHAQQERANALATLDAFAVAAANASDVISLVDPAGIPLQPGGPRVPVDVFAAAVLGIVVATGVGLAIDTLAAPLSADSDVWTAAGLPLIGIVHEIGPPASVAEIRLSSSVPAVEAESFRKLGSNLQPTAAGTPQVVLVTSTAGGEGRSTIAAGLAATLAHAGTGVILVEAGTRVGSDIASTAPQAVGLAALLVDERLPAAAALAPSPVERLRLLPIGSPPANLADLLASRCMQRRLRELTGMASTIIIDAGPVHDSGTLALVRWVDLVLLVVDARHTSPRALREAAELLGDVKARAVRGVMNRAAAHAAGRHSAAHAEYEPGSAAAH